MRKKLTFIECLLFLWQVLPGHFSGINYSCNETLTEFEVEETQVRESQVTYPKSPSYKSQSRTQT